MNVKNLVLGIGIFIVFMFLLHNGIRAFYDYPKYEDYCNSSAFLYYPEKSIPQYQNCSYNSELRKAEQNCYDQKGQPIYNYDEQGCQISIKECNLCNLYFENARNEHSRIVFIISLIVGILILLIGYLILSVEPVGSSLMASGIGAIVYGTMTNWGNLGNLGRFLLLLIALVLLIWIAYRLNIRNSTNKKKK